MANDTTLAAGKYTHVFTESGNGFPEDGDIVICDNNGNITLLKVIESSPIHTHEAGSGRGNYVYLVCKADGSDWDDLDQQDQDDLYDNGFHVGLIDEDESDE